MTSVSLFLAAKSSATDGGVEVDGLADLLARLRGMVPLVDRGTLDLEEEARFPARALAVEELDAPSSSCRPASARSPTAGPLDSGRGPAAGSSPPVPPQSSLMLHRREQPEQLRCPGSAACSPARSVTSRVAERRAPAGCTVCPPYGPSPSGMVWSKRALPPPRSTSTLWSIACSAIEPGPPADFLSCGQARHVRRPLAAARDDVRLGDRRGRVGQLRGRHVRRCGSRASWASSRIVCTVLVGR